MKSAYELAMERLNKTAPVSKLTAAQKEQIAELESKYKARIAQREIAVQAEIESAAAAGKFEKMDELRLAFGEERRALQTELEAKKAVVHEQKSKQ